MKNLGRRQILRYRGWGKETESVARIMTGGGPVLSLSGPNNRETWPPGGPYGGT